jgi:NADP-dependent 3-hydroxy acid dehydrogenase YdfG
VAGWAVITGASAGIGAATAKAMADLGFNLILAARRKPRLDEIASRLEKKSNIQVITSSLDVADKALVEVFAGQHADKKIEVLVNNAGLAKGIEKMNEARIADWDLMIDTNVKGLLYMTRAFLPGMIKRGRGHIVNLGSVAGRWTYPGGAVYCATKFAVRALSEGLRMDLLGSPVRVTNIEPGMVETEFSEVRLGDAERARAVYKGIKPLSAHDVAEAIKWCVERPAHVNVQELVLFPTQQAAIGMVHRNSVHRNPS